MSKLTYEEEDFCQNIVSGMNKIEAYREAYDCTSMNAKNIPVNACRILKKS